MKIIDALLTKNIYSRPDIASKKIRGIVVHWVANQQTTAMQNRNFFDNRKYGNAGYGSAHYIIDLNGDILRCIPESEIAYHVGAREYIPGIIDKLGVYPNSTTIGIECTHMDNTGMMTGYTYNSLIELCRDLCCRHNLNPVKDLYLHHDITGKDCHKWFVDNPGEWDKFKKIVSRGL